MKNWYVMMLIISLICLSADSDSFTMFLIWHAVWLAVLAFCAYKLKGEEE